MTKIIASCVIACRNEGDFIEGCLDSLIAQTFPKDQLEIFIVDGQSSDDTLKKAERYLINYPFIKVLSNAQRTTPFAFNIGIKASQGDFILIMSAHATYEPDYIEKSIAYCIRDKVDNGGGIIITLPRDNSLQGKAVVEVGSHVFGMGNSEFRLGRITEPKDTDTVSFGCYRRDVFDRVGLYDERFIRTQDLEMNHRIIAAGGRIRLYPDILATYYSRSSLVSFFKHAYLNGKWSIYPFKWTKNCMSIRHLIPFFFVSGILFGGILSIWFLWVRVVYVSVLSLYFFLSFYFSVQLAMKRKIPAFAVIMPIAFFGMHFFYGLGSVVAMPNLLLTPSFYKMRLRS